MKLKKEGKSWKIYIYPESLNGPRTKQQVLWVFRKISFMINSVLSKRNEVDDEGKPITISYRTINNYLKDYYGKPKKIRKAFYL